MRAACRGGGTAIPAGAPGLDERIGDGFAKFGAHAGLEDFVDEAEREGRGEEEVRGAAWTEQRE